MSPADRTRLAEAAAHGHADGWEPWEVPEIVLAHARMLGIECCPATAAVIAAQINPQTKED